MSGGDRIGACFRARRQESRAALIFYLAAGDPSIEATVDLMHALVDGGADVIELGYPFCDPILDGPVIRLANRRALDAGGSMDGTLGIVRRFRARDADTPIVLMGYANPIVSRSAALFGQMADAGVDGLIMPDLPLREATALLGPISHAGLVLIPLVPPFGMVDQDVLSAPGIGGFAYCIAQAGPTGGASPDGDAVRGLVAQCRELVALEVAVGFGIKTPALAAAIAAHADAVIVGSALVDHILLLTEQGLSGALLRVEVARFAAGFRLAVDDARRSA